MIGYVEARYVAPVIGHEDDMAMDDPIPVVDRQLNLIGHSIPGHGFVPLGTDINDVPGIIVTTTYGG